MRGYGTPRISKTRSLLAQLSEALIERNYRDLGCDDWDPRRVQLLCAKLGDTPEILGVRMRLGRAEFDRRMETGQWSKQDGLILTMLEREVELLRGGNPLPGKIISTESPQ